MGFDALFWPNSPMLLDAIKALEAPGTTSTFNRQNIRFLEAGDSLFFQWIPTEPKV